MEKLQLNNEELGKISKVARFRKFNLKTQEYLYPDTIKKEIKNFLNAYKFLNILQNNLLLYEVEIANTIKEYLIPFSKIYKALESIKIELNSDIEYGKEDLEQKAKNIIEECQEEIDTLISDVYPIGKVLQEYDVDSAVGFN